VVCIAALFVVSCAHPNGSAPTTVGSAWTLRWSDEFDGARGAGADAKSWSHDSGDGCAAGNCGWGNNEKEHYAEGAPNASLTGSGELAIVARVADSGLSCYYGPCRYTSAKIKTQGKIQVTHGRVEARIRLPRGQGLWPAFWLLGSNIGPTPWPACGELDIMENHGSNVAQISSAIHGPGYSGGTTPFVHGTTRPDGSFADAFHVFAVEWDSSRIIFSVDNTPHYVVTKDEVRKHGEWPFDQPFFIILNLAVGGNFDGDPKSDAIFPATMLVDWVRVYERANNR
ncbi:MAG: glycoside hydrolase family 16 protein, partial [Gemmatimonadaceae bacterium]